MINMTQTMNISASLEDRLNNLGDDTRQRFIEELLKPKILPREIIQHVRYKYKDDLAPYIVQRLVKDGVNFDNVDGEYAFQKNLYESINKEPMKRSYWGQFNANVPKEIIQELPPWVAFYFYAGVWTKKSTRKPHIKFFARNLRNQTIYKIVYDCVMEGLNTIKNVHNRGYISGDYKYKMRTAPHQKEVEDIMQNPIDKSYAQPRLPIPVEIVN